MTELIPDDGTCSAPDCGEPTPWDMAAIVLDDEYYCSPQCAGASLERMDSPPQRVTLHDPQYRIDRANFVHVSEDSVNITREVPSMAAAREAIAQMTDVFPRSPTTSEPTRTSIKCAADTRDALREVKRDGETWDECLRRLAQLAKATELEADD